jgi:Probable cobalt transporter subunit (CbtB)
MDTPANPATADLADAAAGVGRIPSWVIVALVVTAALALWLVAFDNGQASAAVDSTGTALHELFHDSRHLVGAPCH